MVFQRSFLVCRLELCICCIWADAQGIVKFGLFDHRVDQSKTCVLVEIQLR